MNWYNPAAASPPLNDLETSHGRRASPEHTVPTIWLVRMLRTVGAVTALISGSSLVGDFAFRHYLGNWNTAADLMTFTTGMVAMVFAQWLSARNWKPLLLIAFGLLLASYSLSAVRTRELTILYATILLLVVGAGALSPWPVQWQAGLSLICALDWLVTTQVVPDRTSFALDNWITILAALVIGLVSCHMRRTFERDRSEAQRRAGESESRLRRILEASPGVVSIIRAHDLVMSEILGQGASTGEYDNMIGLPLTSLEYYRADPAHQQFIHDVVENGSAQNAELNFLKPDGETLPYLASATIVDIDDEPTIVCFSQDIADLKKTQRRLEESERRFRSIFLAMPGSAAIMDLNGTFLDINRPMPGTGFTREEVIGKTVDEIGFWSNPDEQAEFERRIARDKRVHSMEVHIGCKGGGSIPAILSTSPLEIEGKRCAVAIVHDIRELKQAQRKAEESQALFRRIFHASTDSMLLSDFEDGTVLDVNPEFSRLTGYARKEAIGRNLRDLRLWSDRGKSGQFVRALREHGEARNIEEPIRTTRGTVPCLISGSLMEVNGRSCCLAITHDITRIKQTQEQLVEAREAALAASRAKSEFLSSMSHEIRTPMNAILGMTELLGDSDLTAEQRRYLEVMVANGEMLLELINSILDLAKIESGRLQIERKEFNLVELVERTVTTFGTRAHSKGLELTAQVAPDVPEHPVGDSLRLRQILVNLVGNAVKFTEFGQVAMQVETGPGWPESGLLKFTISDTGIGIAPDKLETIFSSFTQADSSTTRKYGGTGLGLAIVHRLVGLMGGEISVESEPGKGSRFIFTAQFGSAPCLITPAPPEAPDLTGMNVLIVDDNAVNREIAREMIAPLGALINEAERGDKALDAVRYARECQRPFHLILLAMRMPGIDGLAIATQIRKDAHRVESVIPMLTSDDLKPQLESLRERGLNTYLVKPITRSALYRAISAVMRPWRPTPAARTAKATAQLRSEPAPAPRLLVAEDARDNRLLLSAYLRRTRCSIDFAENGKIAVDKFTAGQYDLVLMDIQMPVMDGYEATRAIRQWERERGAPVTPIVALTASALDDAAAKSLAAGCDAHVTKPLKRATLLEVIDTYAKRPGPRQPGPAEQLRKPISPNGRV